MSSGIMLDIFVRIKYKAYSSIIGRLWEDCSRSKRWEN